MRQVKAKPLGLCACGKPIYADAKVGAVVHELPYCHAFKELEPLAFLSYVRRSRGISDQAMNAMEVIQ